MRAAAGALAGLSLAGVAACGPAGESGGNGAGAGTQSKGPVTLRVNQRTDKYFHVRAQQFTDANPNVKVDVVTDVGYEKLVALLVAGDLGDIIWASTGVGTYFELAGQGHFLQLDSVVAKDKYDLKQHFPRAIDTAKTVDGKLFGLPSLIHVSHIGLFYNTQLFDKAGVALPTSDWTYDQLVDAARKLTTGQTPEGRPAQWGLQTETAYAPLLCFVRSFGGEMLDPGHLGKKVAFDRPPAKQALQYLYDLRHRHRVHPTAGVDQVAMINGNLAMQTTLMSGGIQWARQVADRFEIKNALIPKGPTGKRGSQGHVDMLGVYNKTKAPDEAFALLKWFANKDTSAALFEEVGVPGARFDGWNDPKVATNPLVKPFKDFLENPGPELIALPYNFRMLEAGQTTDKLFAPLWAGQQSPEQVLAASVGPFQTFLDQPRVTTGS
jgi:multiple sugar transport system substrate-binding protein